MVRCNSGSILSAILSDIRSLVNAAISVIVLTFNADFIDKTDLAPEVDDVEKLAAIIGLIVLTWDAPNQRKRTP